MAVLRVHGTNLSGSDIRDEELYTALQDAAGDGKASISTLLSAVRRAGWRIVHYCGQDYRHPGNTYILEKVEGTRGEEARR